MKDDSILNEDPLSVDEIVKNKKRAHRCLYDGCGKLYATVHHLKVYKNSFGKPKVINIINKIII